MSKILKNTTGSDVDVLDSGITVAASSSYTIQTADYLLFAGSDDIITLVGAGTLVVNDGSSDLGISEGIDLIKGNFPSEVTVNQQSANTSIFGDSMSESFEPVAQMSFAYGLLEESEVFEATGGTVTTEDNLVTLKTGTSVGGYGVARTYRPVVYRDGQGVTARLTAIFDGDAVANSLQFAGLFNVQDTLAFGYDGVDFGIIYESYGFPEKRKLEITSATSGTLTLTLDSIAYNIPLTSGSNAFNAYEIEDWMNTNQSVWNVQQIGDFVHFQARSPNAKSGTYSVSGAGLSGTFTQIKAGQSKETGNVKIADFNGTLPANFDQNKPNIYQIKFGYLGFSDIRFYIYDTSTDRFVLAHSLEPLVAATKPSISNRSLKLGWTAASLGSTTDLTVQGGSCAVFIDGESRILKTTRAKSHTNTSVGADFEAIITIKARNELNGTANLGRLLPVGLFLESDGAKSIEWALGINLDLGETNYSFYNENKSIVLYDTGTHIYSGDENDFIVEGTVSAAGAKDVNLSKFNIDLLLGDSITLFVKKISGSNPSVTGGFIWKEDI